MTYYAWLTLFVICAYLVATDASVAKYVVLLWKESRLNYEKLKWWVRYNPDNPLVRYAIRRNADKLARELFDEHQRKVNDGLNAGEQPDKTDRG